jgi:RecJ-like exonuclease
MQDKKINNISLEIQIVTECNACKGTGAIIRQPGPLVFDIATLSKCSNKGDDYKSEHIQKIVEQLPTEVPGFTDRTQHLQCSCCRGTGKIKKHINLSELKQLLQE